MNKLQRLIALKDSLTLELQAILDSEGDILTEDETLRFESKKNQLETVKSQIEMLQNFEVETVKSETVETKAAKSVYSNSNFVKGPEAVKEFETCEQFVQATIFNPEDSRLDYSEYRSEQRMGTGAKGGFLIPSQFIAEVRSLDPEVSLVRPRATVIPAGSPPDAEVSFPALDQNAIGGESSMYGGVQISKVEEGGLKPSTDANLRLITLKPYEMAAIIPLTDKLLRNAPAVSSWATNLLRSALTAFEDTQFLKGNGIGGPLGVLDSGAAYTVNRAVSNQIAFLDIKNVYGRFKGNEGNAVWAASRSAFAYMLSMVGDGGGATNIISFNSATSTLSLYGIPVVKNARMRALGARGDLALMDLSNYLIKDGSGPIIETGFATGQFESNKRSIKVTFNVDGKSWLDEHVVDEGNHAGSPFVVLTLPT